MGALDGVMSFFGFGSSEPAPKAEAPRARAAAPRSRRASDISEIVTLEPKSYADAVEVAASFRTGVPVIVNIGNLRGTCAGLPQRYSYFRLATWRSMTPTRTLKTQT